MEEWFYANAREKCGPIPREQLVEFLKTGVITPGSLVWTKSMAEWQPAIQVPGLMSSPDPEPDPVAAFENANVQPQVAPAAPAAPAAGAHPWEQSEASAGQPGSAFPTPQDVPAQIDPAAAPTEPAGGVGQLNFSQKRPKPQHKRASAKIKTLVVRCFALVLALGILGGGGYLGAQYLGLFEEEIPARLRYLPDSPDFVVTVNVPKVLSVAQSAGADVGSFSGAMPVGGMPFDPSTVQDLTIAGNVREKRWVVVATLASELDIKRLFGGKEPKDSTRAGGTKIYYDRDMAQFGMDFAFALPTKSTMLVGSLDTLKAVLKRRNAPVLDPGFKPLLDKENADAWFAGAANVDALWRLADNDTPMGMSSEQRWLAESISSVSFALSGVSEFDFTLNAQCKNAKDANLIVEKAEALVADARKQFVETMHVFGQPVDSTTKTIFDNLKISTDKNGLLTVQQHIDKEMIRQSTQQLAATGALQQP